MWNLWTGKQIAQPPGHTRAVRDIALSHAPIGTLVAVSGSLDGSVRIWDVRGRRAFAPALTEHSGAVWSVATGVLDDSNVVLSAGVDQRIIVRKIRKFA